MAWRRGLCSRASGQPAADFSRPSQAQAPFRVLTFSPWFRLPGVFRSDLDQIKFVSSIRAINDGNVSDDGCTRGRRAAIHLDFGVGDCVGASVVVPVDGLFARGAPTPARGYDEPRAPFHGPCGHARAPFARDYSRPSYR